MKRLLAVLALSVSIPVLAAPEKAAVIRVADTASIVSAVSKIGEFIGNPMLAVPLAMSVSSNSATACLGPDRAGVPMLVTVYVDAEKARTHATAEVLAEGCRLTVLYPVARGKTAFLESHEGAVEKDGVIKIAEPKDAFVAFSDDGSWAALADDAALARAALADAKRASEPLNGDLAQAKLTPKGISLVRQLIDSACKTNAAAMDKGAQEALVETARRFRQVRSCDFAVRVDEAGLTLRATMLPVAGSDLSKLWPESLAAGDSLAFAGTEAFFAGAYAKGCAQADFDAAWTKYIGFLAKQGIDTASWLSCATQGVSRTITFDFDGCVKYFTTDTDKFKAFNPETFGKDISSLVEEASSGLKFDTPACAVALALKGVPLKGTASARFAHIAPEAAAKKPCAVAVGSLYAAVRALASKAVALLPAEESAFLRPMLQMLPPEGPGGIASYDWREGDSFCSVTRVSPDEIRGLSFFVQAAMGYIAQRQMKAAMQFEPSEDGDDDDDEED